MALPKKRTPTSKKRSRRSHHKFSVKSLMNSFEFKLKQLERLNRDDNGKPFTIDNTDNKDQVIEESIASKPEISTDNQDDTESTNSK
jgi:ribosomal protein L32